MNPYFPYLRALARGRTVTVDQATKWLLDMADELSEAQAKSIAVTFLAHRALTQKR